MPRCAKDQRATNKVKYRNIRMASGPFQHRGRRIIPIRIQSSSDGDCKPLKYEGGVADISGCGVQPSTDVTYEIKRWGGTVPSVSGAIGWEDMALWEAWVIGLFPWYGEFRSAAHHMTWCVYLWLGKCNCHGDVPSQRLTAFSWQHGQHILSLAISTCQPCRLLTNWYAGWPDRHGKMSLIALLRTILMGAFLHIKACCPYVSTEAPHLHVWATLMLQPKRIETVTLTASSESLSPHAAIGSDSSQFKIDIRCTRNRTQCYQGLSKTRRATRLLRGGGVHC